MLQMTVRTIVQIALERNRGILLPLGMPKWHRMSIEKKIVPTFGTVRL